jgi:hypothetical protein
MRYSGNQRFAYRFNGSHFRRHAQATFNFGQPRSEDRGKGSAGANLARSEDHPKISTRGKGFQNAFARNLSTRCPSQR